MQHLQAQCNRLNEITKNPFAPWKVKNGKYTAQIGCYHLDGAYGGWELMRMMNKAGGVESPLRTGHISKKELYNRLSAFIVGVELNS
jgi:hypothetical protein